MTSSAAQPFALFAGATLIVTADGGAPETITFQPADFASIGAATAAEVSAKINASAARMSAAAGDGNDFVLRGNVGTPPGAGRLLVDGRMVLIERAVRYREQPLYRNASLATAWNVDVVDDIPTPLINQSQTIFIDVWHREVDRVEDAVIVDPRIDIQTAVPLRREWAVRVVATSAYPAALATRPAGHSYYPLAELHRSANNKAILGTVIMDVRDTDLSLHPEIAFWSAAGNIVVTTQRFRDVLVSTREAVRASITYITTVVNQPTSPYLAADIAGLECLSAIAAVADQGLAVVNAHALGTQGAFGIMQQLYDAERRFVAIWKTSVLPLVKNGNKIYEAPFKVPIQLIDQYLDGPPPAGTIPIKASLDAFNLDGAVTSQERIVGQLGDPSKKPSGSFVVTYLGAVVSQAIQPGIEFGLRYQITGTLTPDDDITVKTFIDPQWSVTLKNHDGTTPFALRAGPGPFTQEFQVGVTPPNLTNAETLISLEVSAKLNPGANFVTTQKKLKVTGVPPFTEEQYALTVFLSSITPPGTVYEVPTTKDINFTFRLDNKTGQSITVDLVPSPFPWTNSALTVPLTNRTIPPNSNPPKDFDWVFTAPAPAGTVTFELNVVDHANSATVYASLVISLKSVP